MMLKKIISEIDVWEEWRKNYSHYVPLFINEASNKQNWKDWDSEIFTEYFETSADQCVSSLKQGNFSNAEKDRIKTNWDNVGPLLKKIADSQDVPLFDIYDNFRTEILKHTDTNKEAAINRMVAGLQPNLLCTIIAYHHLNNLYNLLKQKLSIEIPHYKFNNWFSDSYEVCKFFKNERSDLDVYQLVTYPWQVLEYLKDKNKNTIPVIQNTMNENIEKINLLKYKKQIILQGPPGTGKTKLAKEIAAEIIRPLSITIQDIKDILKVGQTITSSYDKILYKISAISDNGVSLQLENGSIQTRNYTHIIQAYLNVIENKPIASGETYQTAIAEFILKNIGKVGQFKIIQFHPSYSYEDFVRGIVAESKNEKIEYKNVNKTLGLFAKDALENYKLSTSDSFEVQHDKWINESFNDFKEEIEKEVEQKELLLSGIIGIFAVDNSCFRYGKEWGVPSRLNFADFKKLIKAILTSSLKLEQTYIPKEISIHAHYRSTYYLALLRIFFTSYQFSISAEKQPLKNFVLIIDEINRANLSSVLGELIYALEYRGKDVESMYEVDGSSKLILPDNLFIIGTMNTADRSVGHIDYAIRRRFAFVDVEPKDLSNDPSITFHKILFDAVSALFDTHLSPEFEKKDVQLGHSYFIDKTKEGGSMDIRLEYEIKPILKEYVKDGILIGEDIKQIIEQLQA